MSRRIPAIPNRILVALISPIGDTLLATPALSALRRAFPNADIAALVAPSNAGILSGNPDVDRLIYAPAQGAEPEWRRYLAAFLALRQERFDLIIRNRRPGLIPDKLVAAHYHRVGTIDVDLPWGAQRWPLDLWEPIR